MTINDVRRADPPTFQQLFQGNIFPFKVMGLSSMSGIFVDQKLIRKWWDGTPILIGSVIMCTVLMCECQTMFQAFSDHLNYAIELFSVICSGVLSTTKAMRFWTYHTKFYDVLQTLRTMWKSARSEKLLTEKIIQAAERTRLMTKYYTILVTFLGISYMIRPYILFLDYHFNDHTNVSFDFSQIVYPSNLPFTIDSFTKYFMCVTYQQLVVVAAVIPWISSDTLFAQLTTHVSLHFLILADKLIQTISKCGNLTNDQQISRKMGDIIDNYQQLFECCKSIETFFNPIMFFTILSNAMNLCSCLYRLDEEVKTGNWDEVTKTIAHLITLSIQTVIFCSFSETLTQSSTQMSEAIYHSQWTDCNQKVKISLLIIMMRAQKEFSYTAYGIITLNYNQLTKIANAAVSYFMLLRNFS